MAQESLVPVTVPGVNAYAARGFAAGGTVSLRVSSDQDCQMCVVRLGPSLDGPADSDVPIFNPQPFTKHARKAGSRINKRPGVVFFARRDP